MGYLANRGGLKVGSQFLQPGMPFPPGQVTPSLLAMEWVVTVGEAEYAAACAQYGTPPENLPPDGQWQYVAAARAPVTDDVPKRRRKTKVKT